jgi:hypothetical protein
MEAQPSATSKLNRVGADVSRGSMDHYRLTGFEVSMVEQRLPRP